MLAKPAALEVRDILVLSIGSMIDSLEDRLSVFWSGVPPPPPPTTVPSVGLWESLGCFKYVRLFVDGGVC